MIKFTLTLLLTWFSVFNTFNAQSKYDYNWVLGYNLSEPEKYLGGIMLDFHNNIISPEYFNIKAFSSQPAFLSTPSGRLLAYSNGCKIYNAQHEVMINGDSLNYGYVWTSYCDVGYYPGTQNKLMLNWPNDTSKAILFHVKVDDDFSPHYLLYSIMEFPESNPLGKVTTKNYHLLNPGKSNLITATQHANGRDWWIILPEGQTNRFFILFLDPAGISLYDTVSIGTPWGEREWASQAVFTPDGSKYIRFNPWKGLDIIDFDRCSGSMSSIIESGPFTNPIVVGGGAGVSVDSRFLYVSNVDSLFQFDLKSSDILNSKTFIASYDGYLNPFWTTFYQMVLAPDEKIYMFSTNGVRSLHVIEHPERKALECEFNQHAIQMTFSLDIGSPNIPYFRLGPLDGSPCDTLGMDNLPVADFRYVIDSINPRKVHQTNTSYFNPEEFLWDYDNQQTSSEENPEPVLYSDFGLYQICLTVSNEYGEHTFCREIHLEDTTTAINNLNPESFQIRPNPFSTRLSINSLSLTVPASFTMFNFLGEMVYSESLHPGMNEFTLPQLPNGVFFYTITSAASTLDVGKIVKIH